MKKEEVYGHIDHTLLKAFSTTEQIEAIAEEALKYGTASICIPASFVNYIHNKYKDVNICTVIGFPLGYSTTSIKVAEAKQAIEDGANEIDMVINIGWAKEHKFDAVTEEIKAVKQHCEGKLLKVIIETCLLTDDGRSRCAKSSPIPARTTSRPPPVSAVAAPPVRTWPCSPSTWGPT